MKKSKALAIVIAIVLALPVLSIYGNTKLGHSNEYDTKSEQYHGVYYRNTLVRKYKHYSQYKRVSKDVESTVDGLPITPDRTVTFRAYVTGNTLGYRVNKDKFITNGFMSWYALDRLNNRMEGNLSYKLASFLFEHLHLVFFDGIDSPEADVLHFAFFSI